MLLNKDSVAPELPGLQVKEVFMRAMGIGCLQAHLVLQVTQGSAVGLCSL